MFKFDRDCLVKWIQFDYEIILEEFVVFEEMIYVFKYVNMLKLIGKVVNDEFIKMKIQIDLFKEELENVEQNLELVKFSYFYIFLEFVKERKEVLKIYSDFKDVINVKDEFFK